MTNRKSRLLLTPRLSSVCVVLVAILATLCSTARLDAAPEDIAPLIEETTAAVVYVDLAKVDLLKDMSSMTKTVVDTVKTLNLPPMVVAQVEPLLKTLTLPMVTKFNPPIQKLKKSGKVSELFVLITPGDEDIPMFVAVAADDTKTEDEVAAMREALKMLGCEINFQRHGFVFGIAPPSQRIASEADASEIASEADVIKTKIKARAKERFGEMTPVERPELTDALKAFEKYPIRGVMFKMEGDEPPPIPPMPGLDTAQLEELQKLINEGMRWGGFGLDIRGLTLVAGLLLTDDDTAQKAGAAITAQRDVLVSGGATSAPGGGAMIELEQMLNLVMPKVEGSKLVIRIDPQTLAANPEVLKSFLMGFMVGSGAGGGGMGGGGMGGGGGNHQ